jgi:hypothetical protein
MGMGVDVGDGATVGVGAATVGGIIGLSAGNSGIGVDVAGAVVDVDVEAGSVVGVGFEFGLEVDVGVAVIDLSGIGVLLVGRDVAGGVAVAGAICDVVGSGAASVASVIVATGTVDVRMGLSVAEHAAAVISRVQTITNSAGWIDSNLARRSSLITSYHLQVIASRSVPLRARCCRFPRGDKGWVAVS